MLVQILPLARKHKLLETDLLQVVMKLGCLIGENRRVPIPKRHRPAEPGAAREPAAQDRKKREIFEPIPIPFTKEGKIRREAVF